MNFQKMLSLMKQIVSDGDSLERVVKSRATRGARKQKLWVKKFKSTAQTAKNGKKNLSQRLILVYICLESKSLPSRYINSIWTPNTCLINSKRTMIHSSPTANIMFILYEVSFLFFSFVVDSSFFWGVSFLLYMS